MGVMFIESDCKIEEIHTSTGKGKWYLVEPVCRFRNKHVPCIVTCYPGGGTNQKILIECLKKMDELEIFDRFVAIP